MLGGRHDFARMNSSKAKRPTARQLYRSGGLHLPRKASIAAALKRYDKMEHPVDEKYYKIWEMLNGVRMKGTDNKAGHAGSSNNEVVVR